MEFIYCKKGCCTLKTSLFDYSKMRKKYKPRYKAGVFLYCKEQNKVLIVQSNGKLWGAPKGTIKKNEKIVDCAIRELVEETGILLSVDNLRISTNINYKASYYFVEMKYQEVFIQKTEENNDVNSLGWIKPSCILDLVKDDTLKLNKHFIILLKKFLNFEIY